MRKRKKNRTRIRMNNRDRRGEISHPLSREFAWDQFASKRHSTVPRGTCLRRGAVGLAGTGTSARHRGHVGRRRSQASTQRAWKACGQQGSARTVSPSSTAPRHTAHSAAAAAALPPRRGGSTKQGSRAMAAESRPPPDDEPPIPAPTAAWSSLRLSTRWFA
ncbi:Os01g0212900 [Oryza sativa Japonica Group]|uniref:Os01g0212900 protein n=1 Tax=Oryza sativa subsp. japonica TaxID=39947 RepID=A0A0N7KCJ6_ORYSJ|nr:Os01g0212900 [Oryza sativa Japonica Group]